MILDEKRRSQLISKSRLSNKGNQRFNRRRKSRISSSSAPYNNMEMIKKIFNDDIVDLTLPVRGETDDYEVVMSFGGVLEKLRDLMKSASTDKVDYRFVYRAVLDAYNNNDIYVHCNCPDSKYRMAYWQTKNDVIANQKEDRPSDITNPHDSLGNACKHELLVMTQINAWIAKLASAITNYIKYVQKSNQEVYEKTLYPLLFGKNFEEEPIEDENDIDLNIENKENQQEENTNDESDDNSGGL